MTYFNHALIKNKSTTSLLSSEVNFTIDWSFKMSYCMSFYLNWHRNQARSKLNMHLFLRKVESSIFNLALFLCQFRQKFIQCLILKLQSMVKLAFKDQSEVVLLYWITPWSIQAIYYINCVLSRLFFQALYYQSVPCQLVTLVYCSLRNLYFQCGVPYFFGK